MEDATTTGVKIERPTLLKGWMQKKGAKGLIKTYKKRFFQQKEVNCHRLYYYPSDDGIGAFGFIDLLNVSRITFAKKDQAAIHLHTPKRTYFLKAPSRNEALYWVTGLNLWKDFFATKRRTPGTGYGIADIVPSPRSGTDEDSGDECTSESRDENSSTLSFDSSESKRSSSSSDQEKNEEKEKDKEKEKEKEKEGAKEKEKEKEEKKEEEKEKDKEKEKEKPQEKLPAHELRPRGFTLQVTATFDYIASDSDELSFKKGDKIQGIKEVNSDWWMGEVGESRGLFPKSYCSMSAAEPTARMAVAVFDYTPDKEDQDQFLLLKEGEILTIISCEEGPWWYGNLNGKQGYFPSDFVKLYDDKKEAVVTAEAKKVD